MDVYRGEIWIADLSPVNEHEQDGIRPVLILSADRINNNKAGLCIVIPITSIIRNLPVHVAIEPPEGGLRVKSSIKCESIRSISKDRFLDKWGSVSKKTMKKVEDILRFILGL
jgi:mRNA interferase MazF